MSYRVEYSFDEKLLKFPLDFIPEIPKEFERMKQLRKKGDDISLKEYKELKEIRKTSFKTKNKYGVEMFVQRKLGRILEGLTYIEKENVFAFPSYESDPLIFAKKEDGFYTRSSYFYDNYDEEFDHFREVIEKLKLSVTLYMIETEDDNELAHYRFKDGKMTILETKELSKEERKIFLSN